MGFPILIRRHLYIELGPGHHRGRHTFIVITCIVLFALHNPCHSWHIQCTSGNMGRMRFAVFCCDLVPFKFTHVLQENLAKYVGWIPSVTDYDVWTRQNNANTCAHHMGKVMRNSDHYDVMVWTHPQHYWPFLWGNHRSPAGYQHRVSATQTSCWFRRC